MGGDKIAGTVYKQWTCSYIPHIDTKTTVSRSAGITPIGDTLRMSLRGWSRSLCFTCSVKLRQLYVCRSVLVAAQNLFFF